MEAVQDHSRLCCFFTALTQVLWWYLGIMKHINLKSLLIGALLISTIFLGVAAGVQRGTDKSSAGPKDELPEPAHTVKLEFQIKGEGGGSFLVLCSGGEYSINLSHFGPDNEHSQEFNGTVLPIADPTKIGFTYSVVETHKNIIEDVEASYAVKGSALLKAGKETALGFLGNRSLVVIATVDD